MPAPNRSARRCHARAISTTCSRPTTNWPRTPTSTGSAIAVVGSSYGGYLATILTSMRPVSWLALRAPALYIDTGWELPKLQLHQDHDLRAYRRSFVEAATDRALRACAAFKGDVLLLESEHDDFIPPAVIKSYRAAFHPCPLAHLPLHAGGRSRRCRTRRASASTPGCSCSGSPRCSPMHAVIAAALRWPRPRPARPGVGPGSRASGARGAAEGLENPRTAPSC